MKKYLFVLAASLLLIGCDDIVLPETVWIPTGQLGINRENGLIVYNGSFVNSENNNLNLGYPPMKFFTADEEVKKGKRYKVSVNNQEYNFFRTELPIIFINTDDTIVDEPKIKGEMRMLQNDGSIFDSNIGIEIRGDSSQIYPKKSYSFELRDENDEDVKESLLGMREDDDWILDSLSNEPIRVRDFTSHDIWLRMGRIQDPDDDTVLGINRKYCELFLNGEYRGVYYLSERVDRKQLGIKKYKNGLKGELYKGDSWDVGVAFERAEDFDSDSETWSGYEAEYPDEIGEIDWSNLHDFVSFVVDSSQADFNAGIASRLDIDNAIDYYIFLNLISALDNRGKNLYTGKIDSSSLYFFVPWDMDGSWGNDWSGKRIDETDRILSNGLFDKLLGFPDFRTGAKKRWSELRSDLLETENIKEIFRTNYNYLTNNAIYHREALIPDLTQRYHKTEITFIESWIDRRVSYLDSYFSEF